MAAIISESDFEEKVIKSKKPVLVDFFATWCGPCQMMGPVVDELSEDVKDTADVYKVDVDASGNLANQYQIMSIPTILIFRDGKVVKQFNGATSKQDLEKELK